MQSIDTPRLVLQTPDQRIVEPLIDFYLSQRSSMAGGNVAYPEAVMRTYSALGHWAHRGYGMFALTDRQSGNCVGMSGPYFPPGRPETEVGWILFDGYEGKGFATEAAHAAVTYAKNTLKWTDIVHYIDAENCASIAVAERLGATLDTTAVQPKPDRPCLVYRQPTL